MRIPSLPPTPSLKAEQAAKLAEYHQLRMEGLDELNMSIQALGEKMDREEKNKLGEVNVGMKGLRRRVEDRLADRV